MKVFELIKSILIDFKNSLGQAFVETYAADGVDPIKKTINGNNDDYHSEGGQAYIYNIWTIIAGVVGWPNRRLDNEAGQSFRNLGRNFIGRQKDVSKGRNIVNALVVTPINIITLPFKFVRNILKLGTEVVPETLGKFFLTEGTRLSTYSLTRYLDLLRDKTKTTAQKFWPIAGNFSLFVLSLLSTAVGISCRAVGTLLKNFTSPITNVRRAWDAGKAFGGKVGGVCFAAGAVASILAMYGIALVGGVILMATTSLGPWLAGHMSEGAAGAMSSFLNVISPVATAVGHVVMPFVTGVAKGLTWSLGINMTPYLTAMPGVVGFGAMVGGLVSTVGSGMSKLSRMVKSLWYQSLRHEPKPVTEPDLVLVNKTTTQKLSTRLTDVYGKNTLNQTKTADVGIGNKEAKKVDFKSAHSNNNNLLFLVAKSNKCPGNMPIEVLQGYPKR